MEEMHYLLIGREFVQIHPATCLAMGLQTPGFRCSRVETAQGCTSAGQEEGINISQVLSSCIQQQGRYEAQRHNVYI